MENAKKIPKFAEIGWFAAMLLLSYSVAIMSKAGFGVSMIVSPAYVIHLSLVKYLPWFTFGTAEYAFQAVLLAIMCAVIGKFKWRYLLSFGAAVLQGLLLDGWLLVLKGVELTEIYARVLAFSSGIICTGFAIALFFRTYLPIEIYDLFVTEITRRFNFKQGIVKWIYDFSMLALATAITLCVHRNLTGLGVGTLVCAVVNAPVITLAGKLMDKIFGYEPLFPKLKGFIYKTEGEE